MISPGKIPHYFPRERFLIFLGSPKKIKHENSHNRISGTAPASFGAIWFHRRKNFRVCAHEPRRLGHTSAGQFPRVAGRQPQKKKRACKLWRDLVLLSRRRYRSCSNKFRRRWNRWSPLLPSAPPVARLLIFKRKLVSAPFRQKEPWESPHTQQRFCLRVGGTGKIFFCMSLRGRVAAGIWRPEEVVPLETGAA